MPLRTKDHRVIRGWVQPFNNSFKSFACLRDHVSCLSLTDPTCYPEPQKQQYECDDLRMQIRKSQLNTQHPTPSYWAKQSVRAFLPGCIYSRITGNTAQSASWAAQESTWPPPSQGLVSRGSGTIPGVGGSTSTSLPFKPPTSSIHMLQAFRITPIIHRANQARLSTFTQFLIRNHCSSYLYY